MSPLICMRTPPWRPPSIYVNIIWMKKFNSFFVVFDDTEPETREKKREKREKKREKRKTREKTEKMGKMGKKWEKNASAPHSLKSICETLKIFLTMRILFVQKCTYFWTLKGLRMQKYDGIEQTRGENVQFTLFIIESIIYWKFKKKNSMFFFFI